MPRSRDNTRQLKNRTEERLRATPFDEVSQLEAEEQQIRLSTWQRLTEAKVFAEMLTKGEFALVKEELKAGLSCKLDGASEKERIFHIYSKGTGIQLDLNESYVQSLGDNQIPLLQGTIQAGIAGWGSLFWQAKGLLPRPGSATLDAFASGPKSQRE